MNADDIHDYVLKRIDLSASPETAAPALAWVASKWLADARAAGYAEAIEKAAKKAERWGADDAADEIRALAPATTKEPT